MEKYKILKDLVKINTINDKENKEIIEYLEKYLLSLGFKTDYKDKALIMSIGDNPKFGFLGHTDTVNYAKDKWKVEPFKLTQKDGKLYGLGVCDMKGGIAAILDAVTELKDESKDLNLKLYFTYAEETTFDGMKDVLKFEKEFPEMMIFGEPTNNEILVGSKGILEFEIKFIGKSAHSSNPDKGISANMNAVNFIMNINKFYEEEIKKEIDNNFEIYYTTMNVGTVHGGTNKNSVSEECIVTIDFRTVKNNHHERIIKEIEKQCKDYNAEIKITENIYPFINEIKNIETKTSNFITEASLIINKNEEKEYKKMDKIILGLGPITAHEVDEYITEESYEKLLDLYKKLLY